MFEPKIVTVVCSIGYSTLIDFKYLFPVAKIVTVASAVYVFSVSTEVASTLSTLYAKFPGYPHTVTLAPAFTLNVILVPVLNWTLSPPFNANLAPEAVASIIKFS